MSVEHTKELFFIQMILFSAPCGWKKQICRSSFVLHTNIFGLLPELRMNKLFPHNVLVSCVREETSGQRPTILLGSFLHSVAWVVGENYLGCQPIYHIWMKHSQRMAFTRRRLRSHFRFNGTPLRSICLLPTLHILLMPLHAVPPFIFRSSRVCRRRVKASPTKTASYASFGQSVSVMCVCRAFSSRHCLPSPSRQPTCGLLCTAAAAAKKIVRLKQRNTESWWIVSIFLEWMLVRCASFTTECCLLSLFFDAI